MTRAKREPRPFTVADIEGSFELASYWFGVKWCPAVDKTAHGYGIRILRSESISGYNRTVNYDYFELDGDGVITTAPRGHAKDWKPGRVTDIAEAVERYATPPEDAMRFRLGGGL